MGREPMLYPHPFSFLVAEAFDNLRDLGSLARAFSKKR